MTRRRASSPAARASRRAASTARGSTRVHGAFPPPASAVESCFVPENPRADESPAERGRAREDQRPVGADEVDPAAALAQHRDLAGAPGAMDLVSCRGEGRLHLLHRPCGMALEEKSRTARDVGRRHARAVQHLEVVRGDRGEDVDTRRGHVRLELERHRRRPARTRSRRCGRGASRPRCPWSTRRPRSRPGRCPGSRSSRARRRRSRCRRRRPGRRRRPRRCRAPGRRCRGCGSTSGSPIERLMTFIPSATAWSIALAISGELPSRPKSAVGTVSAL